MKRALRLLTISISTLAGLALPAIATGGATERFESWDNLDRSHGVIYKMHRPGFRVRLKVRGNEIFPVRIWALRKCSDGFEGGGGLSLSEPGQEITIQKDGRFRFTLFTGEGFWRRTRLGGRVRTNTISGFYQAWAREGPSGPICGTGRPGDRALRFVARADRS
jgi:hypothetical protein